MYACRRDNRNATEQSGSALTENVKQTLFQLTNLLLQTGCFIFIVSEGVLFFSWLQFFLSDFAFKFFPALGRFGFLHYPCYPLVAEGVLRLATNKGTPVGTFPWTFLPRLIIFFKKVATHVHFTLLSLTFLLQ